MPAATMNQDHQGLFEVPVLGEKKVQFKNTVTSHGKVQIFETLSSFRPLKVRLINPPA
jgi:hypothetical protein